MMSSIQIKKIEWCRREILRSHEPIFTFCNNLMAKIFFCNTPNDNQAVSIKRGILSCSDLIVAEGRYKKYKVHQSLQAPESNKKGLGQLPIF